MATSLQRSVDLFFVAVFATFALIAVTIDFVQSTYGAVLEAEELEYGAWPPRAVVDSYVWWCREYDQLLGHNPVWFETLALVSPFLYVPFYFAAIYAFLFKKEWIRIPALMWAWGLLLGMLAIAREQLEGPYKTENIAVIAAAYGGYAIIPVLVMIRVARAPVFHDTKQKKS